MWKSHAHTSALSWPSCGPKVTKQTENYDTTFWQSFVTLHLFMPTVLSRQEARERFWLQLKHHRLSLHLLFLHHVVSLPPRPIVIVLCRSCTQLSHSSSSYKTPCVTYPLSCSLASVLTSLFHVSKPPPSQSVLTFAFGFSGSSGGWLSSSLPMSTSTSVILTAFLGSEREKEGSKKWNEWPLSNYIHVV